MKIDKANFVYFGLSGEFDPDEVASEIGVAPTKSAAKHSIAPARKHPRVSILRFAQVHADAEIGQNALDFYDLADQVVDQLERHVSKFADAVIKHKAHATFQIVLDFPVSDEICTPALGFSRRVVEFIAATGASIDVDMYRC